MNRFARHIILFLLGLILLYIPAVWLAGRMGGELNVTYVPANYGHSGLRLAEADTASSPQVLFIGSSHCYRTFDTRCYDSAGVSCFNLGSSNQTPRQSLALLQRYLQRWNPQLVVIEVHPDIMENSGDESACDLLSNTRIDAPMLAMALGQRNLRVFNTMVCGALDRLIQGGVPMPLSPIVRVATSAGDTQVMASFHYVGGGFVELPTVCYQPTPIAPKRLQPNIDQLEALAACVQLLEEKGIDCLLVEVPATRQRYASYLNHQDFEHQLADVAGKGIHLRGYLNLNDDAYLIEHLNDTVTFFDDDHLNQVGVDLFNQYFLSCLSLD